MIRFFILVVVLISFQKSHSYELGCQYQPNQLNDFGTGITKIVSEQKISLPENVPVQTRFDYSLKNGQVKFTGTYEAFLRPSEDDFISLIPIPILGFDVSRDRVVIYMCAHVTEDPDDTHLTIYFMRGYNIDPSYLTSPSTWGHAIGDALFKPQLRVKPVPASLLGISDVRKFFLRLFRYIPFVDLYFETISLIQRLVANAFGDVTGLGVERVELTRTTLRVSSGIDLDNPREARFSKTFKLKRPELGPGANTASENSIRNLDDDAVLKKMDSLPLQYEEVQEPLPIEQKRQRAK